ncbi:MAG: glycosyltransferase [Anaerolineae bacterium]|nr:glycosyltransferase [Anaerolineae bacterium]
MKLLFVVSSLDITQPFSATPAWWMLLKGLYESGVDVIAAPYQGPPIESLWWRAAGNPARWQGDFFKATRDALRRLRPAPPPVTAAPAGAAAPESRTEWLTRTAAQTLIAPLWARHLDRLLTQEPDIDAVIFLTVPLNHLRGVAGEITRRHGKPVLYYDGDIPASLPAMQGFASGFRIYQGADVSEYAAFISNSTGGAALLEQMGARRAHTLWYAADPDVYSPLPVPAQDLDVFFYGHGSEYRAHWIEAMLAVPSQRLPQARFAVRGTGLHALGRAQTLPYLSFSRLREYAARSRLNLCITRQAHAGLYGSSSMRPFELAAMGCCLVSNPYAGLELWLEPEHEVFVVHSAEEAVERYRYLLAHEAVRQAAGQAARARVLKQHTFRHRAAELRAIVQQYL